ncbi:hypothetical protein AAC387_Pa04g0721 [Persea americana]
MNWNILYVPDKITTNEQSTVDVFASVVEPRITNTLIRKLNQVAPLENLHHVKRVRKILFEGKAQLSVILCCSLGQENQLDGIPDEVLELIKSYQLHPFFTKVAKYAASSKEEWEEQCKLWPTSYHPPTYNIDGINGFSEEDSQKVFHFMKVAIGLTKSGHLGNQVVNAAVIVDPATREVIANACDQTFSITNKSSLQNINWNGPAESIPSHHVDANEVAEDERHSTCTGNGQVRSYTNVSCLYPWSWTQQQPYTRNSLVKCGSAISWHPLRHAAVVAIDCAANRDRSLFPSSELSTCQSDHVDHLQSSTSSPAKRQKTELLREDETVSEASANGLPSEMMRPYLCTGFDIYVVWEPCTMCAMALVHQRIRRIFYAFPNPNAGALGSVHRLQGEKSLNHHYAVFRVLLPEEILDNVVSNCA